ncbi:TolC family protein [bacterium]|nr:TolC family protein [bacterium]
MTIGMGLALAVAVQAASGEAPELDLPALWQLVEQHNPELAALRAEVEAGEGRILQARLYPNPSIGLETEDGPLDHVGLSRSKNTVAWVQPLEWGGKRAARAALASAETIVLELAYRERRQELFVEAAEAYAEGLYLAAGRRLYASLEAELAEPLEIARQRVAMRAAPRWEAERTELVLRELRLSAASLPEEQRAVEARLARLLGAPAFTLKGLPQELRDSWPELDEEALSSRVLARHPALARAGDLAAWKRLASAQVERRPDLEARLALGRNTAENENVIEAGLAIPLPLWNRNQGAIAEAKALAAMAEAARAAQRDRVQEETATALARYRYARSRLAFARSEFLSLALAVEALTREGYRTGKQSYLEWMDARRAVIEARKTEWSLLSEAHAAAARLWALADAPIDSFALKGD